MPPINLSINKEQIFMNQKWIDIKYCMIYYSKEASTTLKETISENDRTFDFVTMRTVRLQNQIECKQKD